MKLKISDIPPKVLVIGLSGIVLSLLVAGLLWLIPGSVIEADDVTGVWAVQYDQPQEPIVQDVPPGASVIVPACLKDAQLEFTLDSMSLQLPEVAPVVVPCTFQSLTVDRILIQLDRAQAKQATWPLTTTIAIIFDRSDANEVSMRGEYWSVTLRRVP